MTPTLPDNISLAVNAGIGDDAVSKTLCGKNNTLAQNLGILGRYYPIKIWFTEPVKIGYQGKWVFTENEDGTRTGRKNTWKEVKVYTFKGFYYNGSLYYKKSKRGRFGYPITFLDKIKKWELVLKGMESDKFKNYETFRKKFDTRFITEIEIEKLWKGRSNQHGGQYRPSDFKQMGPRGREVMKRFITHFTDVTNPDKSAYRETSYGTYLSERYHSSHHTGRDISISHNIECPYVHYSSEYQGCGNGSYGLVANKRTWLHLEDD